jgi:hypothetical protein
MLCHMLRELPLVEGPKSFFAAIYAYKALDECSVSDRYNYFCLFDACHMVKRLKVSKLDTTGH